MRNPYENSELFTAHATVAAAYYMLKQIQEQMNKERPKSAIEVMIDQQTGYGKELSQKRAQEISDLFEVIIENKKMAPIYKAGQGRHFF